MKAWLSRSLCAFAAVALALLTHPLHVQAAAPIVLDGAFGDWAGQSCIPDPSGDASDRKADILSFCFANNADDPTAYFMIQRGEANNPLDLRLYIDANNNGVYGESADRYVTIRYNPHGSSSSVDVAVYTGSGQFISTVANGADWGEGGHDGGGRVEWGISFTDMGIAVGQPIRMYVDALSGNISDSTNEVQWSPANALGVFILGSILLSSSIGFGYKRSKAGKDRGG